MLGINGVIFNSKVSVLANRKHVIIWWWCFKHWCKKMLLLLFWKIWNVQLPVPIKAGINWQYSLNRDNTHKNKNTQNAETPRSLLSLKFRAYTLCNYYNTRLYIMTRSIYWKYAQFSKYTWNNSTLYMIYNHLLSFLFLTR